MLNRRGTPGQGIAFADDCDLAARGARAGTDESRRTLALARCPMTSSKLFLSDDGKPGPRRLDSPRPRHPRGARGIRVLGLHRRGLVFSPRPRRRGGLFSPLTGFMIQRSMRRPLEPAPALSPTAAPSVTTSLLCQLLAPSTFAARIRWLTLRENPRSPPSVRSCQSSSAWTRPDTESQSPAEPRPPGIGVRNRRHPEPNPSTEPKIEPKFGPVLMNIPG
jgi:hypothetical protein